MMKVARTAAVSDAPGWIMPQAWAICIVRAMVHYPMSNGRSVAEFLRLLEALQTADANKIATPEGWQPGEDVIVPPPATIEAADARAGESYAYVDWFFSKRPLAA